MADWRRFPSARAFMGFTGLVPAGHSSGGRVRRGSITKNCVWAAYAAHNTDAGTPEQPQEARRRQEPLRKAAQALGPAQVPAAEKRGAAMSLATAVEFATLLTASASPARQPVPGLAQLSARERELVTLAAHGRTDTQIAGQLYISVRSVRSHLDSIRDKSGCRRRADLTRLALQAGLV